METFLRVVAAALRIRGAQTLALELGEVGYIDVAGVAALLECRRLARNLGRDLVLAQVSRQVLAGIRACAACSLLADRLGPRRCGIHRRRRLLCGNHGGRGFCARLPRGPRRISSRAEPS
jgi:ABC-type transporter Mla MlaB component